MTRWRAPAPGEQEAGERSWEIIRNAYDERLPRPRARDWRPVVGVAIGVAVLAAVFSSPGLGVWGSIRDAVRGEDHLLALPSRGRVLVNAQAGVWVVNHDGSKRFLSGYADAAWSPHGLYLAAAPTFAMMALLTGVLGGGSPDALCSVASASPLGGMVPMYLLMSAFHLAPWLKLIGGRTQMSQIGESRA